MDQNNPQKPSIDPKSKWQFVSLSFELGFIIALPLVVLGLLGKHFDNKLSHDLPWITLIGIALAIILTTVWLTKKFKTLLKKD